MKIAITAQSDNFNAHKFYEKQGFNKSSMIAFRKSL